MKVELTQESLIRLESNLIFLVEDLGLPKTKALEIRRNLLKRARGLSSHPFKGQVEVYLESKEHEYRRLVEGEFKIVYYVNDKIIYVTDFFYTHMNPSRMRD